MRLLKSNKGAGFSDTLLGVSVVCAVLVFALPEYLKTGADTIKPSEREVAMGDLDRIAQAIQQLEQDTGVMSGYPGPNPCVNDGESLIDRDCRMGLFCTNGKYANWSGPYLTSDMRDPWGNPYYLDNDFYRKGKVSRVVASMGPNGVQDYKAGGDDIVLILCTRGVQ